MPWMLFAFVVSLTHLPIDVSSSANQEDPTKLSSGGGGNYYEWLLESSQTSLNGAFGQRIVGTFSSVLVRHQGITLR